MFEHLRLGDREILRPVLPTEQLAPLLREILEQNRLIIETNRRLADVLTMLRVETPQHDLEQCSKH